MNKSDLIERIAESADISKACASRALDAALEGIIGALSKGDPVSITGFGTFAVKHRPARTGRNPRTNEEIEIAATNVPGFKAGKTFKDAVN